LALWCCIRYKIEIKSCLQGYHIYGTFGVKNIGDVLNWVHKSRNPIDLYAIAITIMKKPFSTQTAAHC